MISTITQGDSTKDLEEVVGEMEIENVKEGEQSIVSKVVNNPFTIFIGNALLGGIGGYASQYGNHLPIAMTTVLITTTMGKMRINGEKLSKIYQVAIYGGLAMGYSTLFLLK